MKIRTPTFRAAIALTISFCLMALALTPSKSMARAQFTINTVADKKLKELPSGQYWRVETSRAGAGPVGGGADASGPEVAGKVWLFTLGPIGGASSAGDQRP